MIAQVGCAILSQKVSKCANLIRHGKILKSRPMNPMHGAFRYTHHVFDLIPGETVKVTVAEKNLLLMAVQHIDPHINLVPKAD